MIFSVKTLSAKYDVIDNLDSVFLNFSKAIISGNVVDIPVYIFSDDNIFTLDFSFKVDTTKIKYLSIIDHTGHIQYSDYFDPLDSKLRFTSNSFQKYPEGDKKVVSVRFMIIENSFLKSDLSQFMTYLNGDESSKQIIGNDIMLSSSQNIHMLDNIVLKQNRDRTIEVSCPFDGSLYVFDTNGNAIQHNIKIQKDIPRIMELNNTPIGVYLFSFYSQNYLIGTKKVLNQ
jgi:hypothetical protein